jgi:hypothetical protein
MSITILLCALGIVLLYKVFPDLVITLLTIILIVGIIALPIALVFFVAGVFGLDASLFPWWVWLICIGMCFPAGSTIYILIFKR